MAQRRMFAKTIIDSDAFLDMPATTQLLYFHLAMRADDDGFINKPKTIMRICNSTADDMNVLIAKKFIIPFDSGVVVIKHWRIHNYIRKDTYTETKYKDEKSALMLDDNDAYTTDVASDVTIPSRTCDDIVTDTRRKRGDSLTQVRLGKDRLGKDNTHTKARGRNPNVWLTDEEYEAIDKKYPQTGNDLINRLSAYKKSNGKEYEDDAAMLTWMSETDGQGTKEKEAQAEIDSMTL